jgi:hypothetical protein
MVGDDWSRYPVANPRIFYTSVMDSPYIPDFLILSVFDMFEKDTYSSNFYLYKCDLFEVELLLSKEDGIVRIEDVQYEHLRRQLED